MPHSSGFDRRKPLHFGVGQELGRRESIHEILVYVEFQVGDAVADRVDFPLQGGVEEQPRGSLQGAVAEDLESVQRKIG